MSWPCERRSNTNGFERNATLYILTGAYEVINLETAVRVEEVGNFPEGRGAVLMCDGKKVTVMGLTKEEAKLFASHLYQELVVTITAASASGSQT